jgi:hypothetical protein
MATHGDTLPRRVKGVADTGATSRRPSSVSSNASLENAGAAVYPEPPKRVALVRLFQHSIVETSSRSRAIPRHHPQ